MKAKLLAKTLFSLFFINYAFASQEGQPAHTRQNVEKTSLDELDRQLYAFANPTPSSHYTRGDHNITDPATVMTMLTRAQIIQTLESQLVIMDQKINKIKEQNQELKKQNQGLEDRIIASIEQSNKRTEAMLKEMTHSISTANQTNSDVLIEHITKAINWLKEIIEASLTKESDSMKKKTDHLIPQLSAELKKERQALLAAQQAAIANEQDSIETVLGLNYHNIQKGIDSSERKVIESTKTLSPIQTITLTELRQLIESSKAAG